MPTAVRIAELPAAADDRRAAVPALDPTSRSNGLARAAVIGRTAGWRLREGKVAAATALLDHALDICCRDGGPCERIRLDLLQTRAACHEQAGNLRAAATDLRAAIALAERLGDRRVAADASSRIAAALEGSGDCTHARYYAEQARTLYVSLQDWPGVTRLMTVLGRLPVA
jgi:hypothetical protein